MSITKSISIAALLLAMSACGIVKTVTGVSGGSALTGDTTTSTAVTADPAQVYNWATDSTQSLPDFHPFSWIVDANEVGGVARIKAELDRQTFGHRSLFWFHGYEDFLGDPADNAIDPLTHLDSGHPYPLFTHGIAKVKARMDQWYANYKAAGGQLDQVVLDFENGESYWNLSKADYAAIQKDPRYLSDAGLHGGYNMDSLSDPAQNADAMTVIIWDYLEGKRQAAALNEVMFETAKKYFPNVTFSNFGRMDMKASFKIPDFNGWRNYLAGDAYGTAGNMQAPVLYGGLGLITVAPWTNPEGSQGFERSPFNALLYDLNNLRAAKLSSPEKPLAPWLAYKTFADGSSLLFDNDFYQEQVFHSVLTGTNEFLFWNANNNDPSFHADNRILQDSLSEVNSLVGFSDRKPLVDSMIGWNDTYILSSMSANGHKISRLTFKPGTSVSISSTTTGTSVRIGNINVNFENSRPIIKSDTTSSAGVWIDQPL